jgi:hypothetical protein
VPLLPLGAFREHQQQRDDENVFDEHVQRQHGARDGRKGQQHDRKADKSAVRAGHAHGRNRGGHALAAEQLPHDEIAEHHHGQRAGEIDRDICRIGDLGDRFLRKRPEQQHRQREIEDVLSQDPHVRRLEKAETRGDISDRDGDIDRAGYGKDFKQLQSHERETNLRLVYKASAKGSSGKNAMTPGQEMKSQ